MGQKCDGKGCADSPAIVAALFDWTVKTFKRPYSMSFSLSMRGCVLRFSCCSYFSPSCLKGVLRPLCCFPSHLLSPQPPPLLPPSFVAQTRGHIAGTLPPASPSVRASIFVAKRVQHFLPLVEHYRVSNLVYRCVYSWPSPLHPHSKFLY